MKTEQQYFEEAISLQAYMERMTTLKEESFAIYQQFEVPANDELIALLKEKNLRILTITEDWCGDAMVNNPIIRRIAEAANLNIRAVYRDADTDLIDRHLTNGGRSIPKYLFLNEAGQVIGSWGPRADKLQKFVDNERAKLPAKEAPNFEIEQKALFAELRQQYIQNSQFHQDIYEDFKEKIIALLKP